MKKSDHRVLEIAAISVASFAAGLIAGMLLAPKSGRENRAWVNDRVSSLGEWVNETGQKSVQVARKELGELRHKVKRGIDHAVPDLYAATQGVELKERDLLEK